MTPANIKMKFKLTPYLWILIPSALPILSDQIRTPQLLLSQNNDLITPEISFVVESVELCDEDDNGLAESFLFKFQYVANVYGGLEYQIRIFEHGRHLFCV